MRIFLLLSIDITGQIGRQSWYGALYSKRILLTAVTNSILSIYTRSPMIGMLASRLLPLPLPPEALLPLDRPGMARPRPELAGKRERLTFRAAHSSFMPHF